MQRSRFRPQPLRPRQSAGERAMFVLAGTLAVVGAVVTIWAVVTSAAPWWILLIR